MLRSSIFLIMLYRNINQKMQQGRTTMFTQAINSWADQSKAFFEPVIEFNQIALSQAQKIGEKQLSLVNDYAKLGLEQLSKASKITTAEELQKAAEEQFKSIQSINDKVMKDTADLVSFGQELGAEWKTFADSKLEATAKTVKAKAKA